MQNLSSNYIAKDLIRVLILNLFLNPILFLCMKFPLKHVFEKCIAYNISGNIDATGLMGGECNMLNALRPKEVGRPPSAQAGRLRPHTLTTRTTYFDDNDQMLWPPGSHILMTMTTCFDHQDNFLTTGSSYSDHQDHILWPPGPHDHENCIQKRVIDTNRNNLTAKNGTKMQLEI